MIEPAIEILALLLLVVAVAVLAIALVAVGVGCILVLRFLLKTDKAIRWIGWPKPEKKKSKK